MVGGMEDAFCAKFAQSKPAKTANMANIFDNDDDWELLIKWSFDEMKHQKLQCSRILSGADGGEHINAAITQTVY